MFPYQYQIEDDPNPFQFISEFDQIQEIDIITNEQPVIWDFAAAGASSPDGKRKRKGKSRGKLAGIDPEDPAEVDGIAQKKIVHRNVERQRRQEMTTLNASLRDFLPVEYIKGKRSMSDHMAGAVSYIKDLQKRVGQLGQERDELKKFSSSTRTRTSSTSNASTNFIQVRPCFGGVEVMICSCDNALSRAMEVLLQEGLCVVSCISTRVDEGMIHTIQTEVSNPDTSQLEQKLIQVLSS